MSGPLSFRRRKRQRELQEEAVRKYGRTDANQREIVAALRKIGVSVAITSDVGGGFPDLVASKAGRNVLLECKTGEEKLTNDQLFFVGSWKGEYHIVRSPEEAVKLFA